MANDTNCKYAIIPCLMIVRSFLDRESEKRVCDSRERSERKENVY